MTVKELKHAHTQCEEEEKELLELLAEFDEKIASAESDQNDLLKKEKELIKKIQALDQEYSHFKD
jgi:predicted  nucleic acid-binding Zn-ribbon protein